MRLFDQKTYDTVRPYMDEEARRILDQQVPQIRADIENEVTAFAASLRDQIKTGLDKEQVELDRQLAALTAQIDTLLKHIDQAASSTALTAERQKLQDQIAAYKNQARQLGGNLRGVVLNAVRVAGIPVPPSWNA